MEITKEAYSEVYAIINLMSLSLINKIPESILQNIEEKRDKEKIVEIDNIEEHDVSEQANKLLAVLYKNYFASDEEKSVIQAKEKAQYEKEQKELHEKYNPDDLFKNKTSNAEETVENTMMIVEYKKSFFVKIKNWFKKIFSK